MGETTVVTGGDGDAFGTFTDKRDGQTYRTVVIGGKRWMAQNLNYKPESGNSWCYNDDESMGEKYGRLYDWETAMAVAPAGWHLPTREEWDDLCDAVGGMRIVEDEDCDFIIWDYMGNMLKARSDWDIDNSGEIGTDDYGFSCLPGGVRDSDGRFGGVGESGDWWTATEESSGGCAYDRYLESCSDGVHEFGQYKSNGLSVRCVAD